MSSVVSKEIRCKKCGCKMVENKAMFKDADGNKTPVHDIRDGYCYDCLDSKPIVVEVPSSSTKQKSIREFISQNIHFVDWGNRVAKFE